MRPIVPLVLAVACLGAWCWKLQDHRPPVADEARHLIHALRATRGGAHPFLFPDPGHTYPPLGYWLMALFTGGDPSPRRAPLAQGGLLLALAGGTFLLGRGLAGPAAGGLAALFLACSPLLHAVLRSAFIDLALAAAVALAMAMLVASRGLTRAGPALGAGLAAGAAALVKFAFLLYLAVPGILAAAGWPEREEGDRRRGAGLLLGGLVLVAGPWFAAAPRIFERMAAFLAGTRYSSSPGPPGSLLAWYWCAWAAADWLWGLPLALATGYALVCLARRRDPVLAGLAACVLVPLAALALLPHRAPHYLLGLLAPSAVLAAVPLARAGAGPVVAAVGVALWLSWGWLGLPPRPELRDRYETAFSTVDPPGRPGSTMLGIPPDRRAWPLGELVARAAARATPVPEGLALLYPHRGQERESTLGLLRPLPQGLDDESMRYEIARQRLRLRVGVVGFDMGTEDAGVLVAGPRAPTPAGFREVERLAFPEGPVRLLERVVNLSFKSPAGASG